MPRGDAARLRELEAEVSHLKHLLDAVIDAGGTMGVCLSLRGVNGGLGLVVTFPERTPRDLAAEIGSRAAQTFAAAIGTLLAGDAESVRADEPREIGGRR